jgi:magnesium transporter
VVVTYHREPIASVDAVGRRLDTDGGLGMDRPVLLVHRLLDTMNDVMVPFVDHLERRLDVIEDDLLSTPTEATRHDLYRLQRDVIQLRRAVVPQAEVIRRLGREGVGLIDEADQGLFRDVHDHMYRMAELSDSYRQLLDSAMSSYRSAQDDQLNDMLRILTLVSAMLLPITMIAGIYGMNFEYMPELRARHGYFVVLASFAVIIIGMATWFRHRGWIGREAEREAERRRSGLGTVLEVPILGSVLKVPVHGARAVARTGQRVVNGRR